MMTEVVFPKLTTYQKEVYDWLGDCHHTGRIAVLKSVRQSGKSFFCIISLIRMALEHAGCVSAIYEPTLALSRNIFKIFQKCMEDTGLIRIANGSLLEIELTNGSTIYFKSTEQTSRGLTVTGLLVLDECAYLDDEQIFTILPLVNAHNAPIIIASTPFTEEGYYFEMFMKGLEGSNENIRSFDWSSHPEISRLLTEEKKALYRQTMSRAKYRTEVEGLFLADEGLLFSGLDRCLGVADDSNRILYLGIDFGTGSDSDYTVLTAINNLGQMVRYYRTNNLTPTEQINWLGAIIRDLAEHYTIRTILAEENSIGKVYIDSLNKIIRPISITNWTTSNSSKQDLVTNLQIALENQYITIIDDPVLLNELKRYQAEVNSRTKTITYNGKGAHDDMVISLMLAYYAYRKSLGQFSLTFI